jgi:hypothetical protein
LVGMKIGRGKPKYSEKTCPNATLSTTNPTLLDQGLNPGRRDGEPATNRLSYLVIVIVEKQMECRLAGETEILGENLPQRHFVHHKTHITRPGFESGPTRWEASDKPIELWWGLFHYFYSLVYIINIHLYNCSCDCIHSV